MFASCSAADADVSDAGDDAADVDSEDANALDTDAAAEAADSGMFLCLSS